jgi:TfoX/Sxy family transcriptional regulator of competence genes
MASELSFVEYIVEKISAECGVTFKKMFGEYTLYSNGKVVALVCDNQLFVKPTEGGRAHVGRCVEASAYSGAKPSLLIEDNLDDSEWLSTLIAITAKELPVPKRRKPKTNQAIPK